MDDLFSFIRTEFLRRGAGTAGACRMDRIRPHLRGAHPETADWANTVFCAAFPYYAGKDEDANLSLYARGIDYHHVLGAALEEICGLLRARFPEFRFERYADSGLLPEVETARLCGAAMTGRHGLAIVPPYGSFVFLGFLLTDWAGPMEDADAGHCENCGACEAACPTGALCGGSVDPMRCLSAITQKKGVLSDWEREQLRAAPLIWGCDACQLACPYNASPRETSISAFRDKIVRLEISDLEGLSNRQLEQTYPHRAFTWRGAEVLRRNLRIKENS